VDSDGNLFIADAQNNRIRKVNTAGTITTVAGNGTSGFSGDGGPATSARLTTPHGLVVDSDGNLFIATNPRVRRVVFVLTVDIDIKPGSDPNAINPKSKGVIPVAVLGSVDFDATQVDFSTVVFGPNGASPVHVGHLKNVNGDGFDDMVFHFKVRETGIACGDTDATLTGETFGGDSITGTDAVKTAGCK
jgi:DNA-binding beta-propeller fold protein YncE